MVCTLYRRVERHDTITRDGLEDAYSPMARIPDRRLVGGKRLGDDGYIVLPCLLDTDSGG